MMPHLGISRPVWLAYEGSQIQTKAILVNVSTIT